MIRDWLLLGAWNVEASHQVGERIMIPEDLRQDLVEKLLCVPGVAGGSRAGRDVLLRGMPHLFLYRNEAAMSR